MVPDGSTADGSIPIENSLANASVVIVGVIQELQSLQSLAKTFGRQSAKLNQDPFEVNRRRKQLRIAEQFAAEMDKGSPRIRELALDLQSNCAELGAGFECYISLSDVEDHAERQRVARCLAILKDSSSDLMGTVEGLEHIRDQTDSFRKFLLNEVGKIRNIDTPLASSSKSLSALIKQLRDFHTLSTTIINRLS